MEVTTLFFLPSLCVQTSSYSSAPLCELQTFSKFLEPNEEAKEVEKQENKANEAINYLIHAREGA